MNQDTCLCGNEAVREQAAQCIARTSDGALTADLQVQFEAWLAQHPQHQYEYDLLARLWGAADALPRARLEALCLADPVRQLPRRRFIQQALAAGVAAAAVGLGWFGWQQHQLNYQGQLQTALGERRQLELPDGSQLELNGRTQLTVDFSAGQRRIDWWPESDDRQRLVRRPTVRYGRRLQDLLRELPRGSTSQADRERSGGNRE